MTLEDLTKRIDTILLEETEPEGFHIEMDNLMQEWIEDKSLFAVRKQFHRLWDADMDRWYA